MQEVGHLDIADNKRLVLSIGEFRGEERIDLRENYLNKSCNLLRGDWNPTRRGANFNSEWLPDFIKLINKLNNL